jgi:Fur family ferric uptake transcriptional regulator
MLARMKAKNRKVSRATVYRTLDLLVQCGLVRKSRLGREHYFYEKMEPGGGHHHMVCTATGKIIEFWDAELDERLRRICQDHKFRPSFISIQIQGLSDEGRRSSRRPRSSDPDTRPGIRRGSAPPWATPERVRLQLAFSPP